MHVIIIEDEKPAAEKLQKAIRQASGNIVIQALLPTVQAATSWLQQYPHPDLIFMDIELSDGLSFSILEKTSVSCPVIFITAFDEYWQEAFEHNGIDYLLKPVDEKDLKKALTRYKTLEKHFLKHHSFIKAFTRKTKTRLIVKKGMENISLRLDDVVLFYTENKIVYVLDRWGKKYLADKNLAELEDELDEATFFRANRQYIVNINFIRGFKSYEKVKLILDLTLPDINHCIIISQEMAPQFREWMHNA